jgi:hypothetical protein
MPVSAAEHRLILDNLTRLAEADIQRMWRAAELQTDLEFAAYVTQAFPEIVDPYHQMAAQTAATIFEEDFPLLSTATPVVVADPLPVEQLKKSAEWALGAEGTKAIDRMIGTTQRAVYNGDRETTISNANNRGMRWVRVARPEACSFCRLLASRTATGTTYSGSGVALKIDPKTGKPFADRRKTTVVSGRRRTGSKQSTGSEYHDHCHCVAKAVPARADPMEYLARTEPQAADLAAQWNNEYEKASKAATSGDVKAILSEWRTFGKEIN